MSRTMGASKRICALAVGAGVAASLAFASPSFATPPAAGSNCQGDGKIDGGGATFQQNVHRLVFEPEYRVRICGPVNSTPATPVDNANQPNSQVRMVLYNYDERVAAGLTGSGSGISAAICRTEAFSGTDVPYTTAQLARMRGTVLPTDSECVPWQPITHKFTPSPAPYPGPTDTMAGIMSFPIAGGAVAIGVNIPVSASCPTPPSVINLSTASASRLFGGLVTVWSDAGLVADTPGLAGCNTPVVRIARSDNSGTTTIFKNYLNNGDGATPLCDGTTWSARTGQNGSNFPSGGTCSPVTYVSGNPAVVNTTATTPGAVGYGDLSDWRVSQPGTPLANIRNVTNTAYVSPVAGSGSNCSFSGAQLPLGGTNGAIGLGANGWLGREDATFRPGSDGYAICGYTFLLIRTGLSGGAPGGQIADLNNNQRRTLYSYVWFSLLPSTQALLSQNFYAPIPATFANAIRTGFDSASGF